MSDELTYEAARTELGEVMRALESGGQSLEESLALWRRGEDLADVCQRWLDDASRRLDDAIAQRTDGSAGTAPTDAPDGSAATDGTAGSAATARTDGSHTADGSAAADGTDRA